VGSVRRLTTREPPKQAVVRALQVLRSEGLLAESLLAQGVRFLISGVVVSTVYIAVTTLLAEGSHIRFQIALGIGWCTAVSMHFTLQRVFVWTHRDGFALPFSRQVGRYLAVAGTQLGVTTAATTLLPSALGLPTEMIYLATAALLTSINFLVFRGGVFHADANEAGST
jgi:putative flippase GtrA